MYKYKRVVRVQDTDATGVLYFANQLQIGLEALEDFFDSRGIPIGRMIEKKDYLLPVVHVEADFFAPIHVGDILELTLTFPKIGVTSFTHASDVFKKGKRVGTVTIVHVVYCPKKKKGVPVPQKIKKLFTTCP